MSHLRELRAWTHELFDQYGWLILANYSRNTRHVRDYMRSVQALEKALAEYYAYIRNRRANSVTMTPLKKLISHVDLLRKRLDRNYRNNRNRHRNRYNYY
jgi:hypothetical protein